MRGHPGRLLATRVAKWTFLFLVPLWAALIVLRSERAHDLLTRRFGVGGGSDLVARYEYSSHQVVFALQMALIVLATFVVFWRVGKSWPRVERPVTFASTIAMLEVLALSPFVAYSTLRDVVAIEVTRSGNVDLVSRTRRESFPLTTLVRVVGSTSTGSLGLRGQTTLTRHRVELAFANGHGKEVLREIGVWGRWDNALTSLVSRLEGLSPRLDASRFWSWRPRGPARGPKSLSALDYASACSGAGRERAPAYERASGALHPLLVFHRSADRTYVQSMGGVPAGWTPGWNEVFKTELVACVTAEERTKAKDCTFTSGNVVELHDTRFGIALHEAQTGRVVARTKLEVKAGECPASRMFRKQREIEDADHRQAVVEFARPHVQP